MHDLLWDELEPDDLPGDLAEIARALDMDAARYFVERWSGVKIYVQRYAWEVLHYRTQIRTGDLPPMLDEIYRDRGLDQTKAFVRRFASEFVYVPTPRSVAREWKRSRVLREYDGTNEGPLAAKYDVSRAWIHRALKAAGKTRQNVQGDLFS
ncbi:MAG: Mor transcription activator family protein [Bacteroidota bacterium]